MRTHSKIAALAALLASVQYMPVQTAIADEAADDARVIELLRQSGSDLSKPHPTDYYFYFRREMDARAAAGELVELGYAIQRIAREKDQRWAVKASRPTVPSLAVVAATTAKLNTLAKKHSGIYDGWEAEVTK